MGNSSAKSKPLLLACRAGPPTENIVPYHICPTRSDQPDHMDQRLVNVASSSGPGYIRDPARKRMAVSGSEAQAHPPREAVAAGGARGAGGAQAFYHLQPLLLPALPPPSLLNTNAAATATAAAAAASRASKRLSTGGGGVLSVRCAEAYGRNLYVGSSDGKIHRYRLGRQGSSKHVSSLWLDVV